MKSIIIVMLVALAVGIGGGILIGRAWFHGAEVVIMIGLGALWLYALWKRPNAMIDTMIGESDEEPNLPSSDDFAMEQEIRRKDRGEERRPK